MTLFLCHLFNLLSLEHGAFDIVFKSAYVTPFLKIADLDPADAKSYRPISNWSVSSNLLERIVSKQLVKYLKDNDLLPDPQYLQFLLTYFCRSIRVTWRCLHFSTSLRPSTVSSTTQSDGCRFPTDLIG